MASQDAVAGAAAAAALTDPAHALSTNASTMEQPVEMSELPTSPISAVQEFKDAVQQQEPPTPINDAGPPTPATSAVPSTAQSVPLPPALTRRETEALGPAVDAPIAHPTSTPAAGPTLNISLMLTTGARHPYKIDEKYLRSRKVGATTAEGTFDPRDVSGYQLKELIWTDWREEWDPRPASPSSIRLIFMGRMIEDKFALKDFPFNMQQTNVVHMTVKPADLIDDEDNGGKGSGKGGVLRARDSEDRTAGCRCVIL